MNEINSVGLLILSGLLAAFSQILLKKSAIVNHTNKIEEYINLYVIASYTILFATTFINMFAMREISYKSVPVIGTVSYVFVIILSKLILGEKISRRKLTGIIIILIGIIIFNSN